MIRLAKVFGLIYTRFLDLQSAEAQAREAAIDTALEKVRSRTMAMHGSGELFDVANTLFSELWNLAGRPIQIGVSLHGREEPKCLVYTGSNTLQAETMTRVGWVLPASHPVLEEYVCTLAAHGRFFSDCQRGKPAYFLPVGDARNRPEHA